MMYNWYELLPVLSIIPLVREDFQHRTVSVLCLALLGILSLAAASIGMGILPTLERIGMNILMLILLGGSLILYLLIRRRPVSALLNHYIGMGDLFFMLAITPLFPLRGCVFFLLTSCITALGWWCVSRWQTIPLVGVMGLLLTACITAKVLGLWN